MPTTPSYFIDKRKLKGAPFFNYGDQSGLATGIAAGTSSAGHVYALRNPTGSGKRVHIARLRLAFIPTTAFGAAQALQLAVFKLTGYSAAHTGGHAVTPAKRRTGISADSVATARMSDAAALTAGTQTLAAKPVFTAGAHGTLPAFDAVWTPSDDYPEVLEEGEGLLVRNEILMGASGVGKIIVEPLGWER